MNSGNPPSRGTAAAMILGAVSFAIVSVLGFGVWAIGGRWLSARVGEIGVFTACLIVFLGASGLLMHPLVIGTNRVLRFYAVFIPAFFAYAIIWSLSWFLFHFGLGEWLASLVGSIAFVAVARWRLCSQENFIRVCVVVFIAHSVGYFLGGKSMAWLNGPGGASLGFAKDQAALLAKLSWGALYGLGFGAGIGYTFSVFSSRLRTSAPLR